MASRRLPIYTALALTMMLSPGAIAATIKYAGSTQTRDEAIHWQTPSVKKSLDIDGDNVYGTMGAVIWGHGSRGEQKAAPTILGWKFVAGEDQFIQPTYAAVDDEQGSSKQAQSGLVLRRFDFQLTGIPKDYQGKTVRVGIMEDVLGKAENAADNFKGLQIVQTTGARSGDSGVQTLRKGGAGTGMPVIYFFDITDAQPGDTFSVKALSNQGGTSGNSGYVGPVCWDIADKTDAK